MHAAPEVVELCSKCKTTLLKGDRLSSDLCNRCAYEAWRRLLKDLKKPERLLDRRE
jgi:DNA-directed RNA polymerase subunit RPC12/RpoP